MRHYRDWRDARSSVRSRCWCNGASQRRSPNCLHRRAAVALRNLLDHRSILGEAGHRLVCHQAERSHLQSDHWNAFVVRQLRTTGSFGQRGIGRTAERAVERVMLLGLAVGNALGIFAAQSRRGHRAVRKRKRCRYAEPKRRGRHRLLPRRRGRPRHGDHRHRRVSRPEPTSRSQRVEAMVRSQSRPSRRHRVHRRYALSPAASSFRRPRA